MPSHSRRPTFSSSRRVVVFHRSIDRRYLASVSRPMRIARARLWTYRSHQRGGDADGGDGVGNLNRDFIRVHSRRAHSRRARPTSHGSQFGESVSHDRDPSRGDRASLEFIARRPRRRRARSTRALRKRFKSREIKCVHRRRPQSRSVRVDRVSSLSRARASRDRGRPDRARARANALRRARARARLHSTFVTLARRALVRTASSSRARTRWKPS